MNESLVDGLISQLRERGMEIVWKGDDRLSLTGNTKEADDSVIAAVKAFKPELLAKLRPTGFVTCPDCNAEVSDRITPEDAAIVCNKVPTRTTRGCPFRRFDHDAR